MHRDIGELRAAADKARMRFKRSHRRFRRARRAARRIVSASLPGQLADISSRLDDLYTAHRVKRRKPTVGFAIELSRVLDEECDSSTVRARAVDPKRLAIAREIAELICRFVNERERIVDGLVTADRELAQRRERRYERAKRRLSRGIARQQATKDAEERAARFREEVEREAAMERAAADARRLVQERAVVSRQQIRDVADRRKIQYLVHFTPIANLALILRHGLLPRTVMNRHVPRIPFVEVDQFRYDGEHSRVSASVSFPNWKMFFKKRNDPSLPAPWVVLVIKASVLWERECLFVKTNAAKSGGALDDARAKGHSADALEEMFTATHAARKQSMYANWTTDPQAEVLVHQGVPVDYFAGVVVSDETVRLLAMEVVDQAGLALEVKAFPPFFKSRPDHWD